jgi:hypothetical protein
MKNTNESIDPAFQIMIAIDACDQGRYAEAKEMLEGLPMVILRTRDAGVHFGHLSFIANAQGGCYRAVLKNARRIWNWSGANTLNEIALRGPGGGKISEPTVAIVPQVIEVLPCTSASEAKLNSMKW